jgi:transketolase C-terminal domain/subunit
MPTAAVSFARAFPERFIDLGIAEQNAVSFAAGLARMGFFQLSHSSPASRRAGRSTR